MQQARGARNAARLSIALHNLAFMVNHTLQRLMVSFKWKASLPRLPFIKKINSFHFNQLQGTHALSQSYKVAFGR
jgi:hypothetical protein